MKWDSKPHKKINDNGNKNPKASGKWKNTLKTILESDKHEQIGKTSK
ncbi:MAG: hypothetical protein AB9861_13405 [Methanosarcina sp.]